MSVKQHRQKLYENIEDNSIVICYSGVPIHTNEDGYYNFEVNSQFFYLTGLQREKMCFMAVKTGGQTSEMLFIEAADPLHERWTGKMPTVKEASEESGISDVHFTEDIPSTTGRYMSRCRIEHVYFDTYRCGADDMHDYNTVKAHEFISKYPAVTLHDLHEACVPLREVKDGDEIELIKQAVEITRHGLDNVMAMLEPGMTEYQVQASFEYTCKYLGSEKLAFNTISASGKNGCMMHYVTNREVLNDGDLILLDLGAKYGNYCSDISRTYPVNGKYTKRQRQLYELVLKANKAVADYAKPGITLRDLNDVAKSVLGQGLVELGMINTVDEVGKYYMHSVSHTIGIDVHDADFAGDTLKPGWVISDEPGLYVDEEGIGIRIEDDLLITETGCEVLSRDIIKDPDEIEEFMAEIKES